MSVPPSLTYVEFQVLVEPWNRYKLTDGTLLLSRLIIPNIIKSGQYDPTGKPLYAIMHQIFNVVRAPKELRGTPTMPPATPEQMGNSIVEEVDLRPITEEWSIYRCDDGTTIKAKPALTTIRRTSIHDALGEPIYMVDSTVLIKDDVPKSLWKKT